jgi:hypothetical protein
MTRRTIAYNGICENGVAILADNHSTNRIVITTRSRFINPLKMFPSHFFPPWLLVNL